MGKGMGERPKHRSRRGSASLRVVVMFCDMRRVNVVINMFDGCCSMAFEEVE